jgi:hypothetical protein
MCRHARARDGSASGRDRGPARARVGRLIVVDPNVRPAAFGDRDDYHLRFERWTTFAHVIKMGDADAQWL